MGLTAVRSATHSTKTANKKSQLVKRLFGKLHSKGHEPGIGAKRTEELSFVSSDESSDESFDSGSSGYG